MDGKTPLYDRHVELGGRIVDFHGWLLPVQYEGILAEHRHCRRSACLFDTSHMGQIRIRVDDPAVIGRVTTQDAAGLGVGRAKYGFLLNAAGGILDDTILMRLDERDFLLVVNAGPRGGDLEHIQANLPPNAVITDQAAAGWSKIDLQGPRSADVLAPLTDADLRSLGYFRIAAAEICGRKCLLSRTGYTGELGYEIFAENETIVTVFDALASDDRVKPAGLGARDSLRLEMCYPLYGQDIDREINPIEADLGVFLRGEHDYLGSQAIKTLADPGRKLVAFLVEGRRRAAHGNAICHDGKDVGTVTSGAFSPSLDVSVGLGYVPGELAEPGTELTVRGDRAELAVTIAEKPLYKHGTCRTRDF